MSDKPDTEEQDQDKPDQKAYQNPGKDSDHPGDKAANKSATEPSEGEPARR